MDRGYYPNWTDRIYTINKSARGKIKSLYRLKGEDNVEIDKRFYPEEIQIVKPDLYRIEKVLKERIHKGKKQLLVKYLNYSDKFNSWINQEDLTDING